MTSIWGLVVSKYGSHQKGPTMAKLTHFLRTGSGSKKRYVAGNPSADAKGAKDEFFAHRKSMKKGEHKRKLSPLQRRMMSGGPT